MKRNQLLLVICLALSIMLACNLPSPEGEVDENEQAKLTLVAQFVTPPEIPAVTVTAEPARFTTAELYYNPDQAIFNGVSSPTSLVDFCTPPRIAPNDVGSGFFMISADYGAMSGQCKGDSPDKLFHREGFLTGGYSAEQAYVQFSLQTTLVFMPYPGGKWTAVLTFEGNGPVVGNTANGVGNFSYTCSAEGELVYCMDQLTSLQLGGTMPYQIVFSP
ncbi:MAG: hypothetical protein HYZ23_09200 [Chloroflexi bacterium]|nr:hypothetical protein [Chloroflexota bacterium]